MAVGQLSAFVQQLRGLLLEQNVTGAADESLLEEYLNRRDEAAFAALVRRHGPMVLGVCRRILGNSHDAEDAFQATFIVLVRKAASVRPRSMVGNWLYGVACRTALDVRRAAAKRRAKEAAALPNTRTPDEDRTELRAALDEELQRLPSKCRAVIVLSDLEGKPRKEVALQLGWPEGTVASRLARARARLAKRLVRFGLVGPGVSVGTLLLGDAASASMPTSLVSSTVKFAGFLVAKEATAALIPAQVAALAKGALKAMLLDKVFGTTAILLVVAFATGTGLVLSHVGGTGTQPLAAPADHSPSGAKAGPPGANPNQRKEEPKKDGRPVAPADARHGKGAPERRDAPEEIAPLKGVWVCVGYERDGQAHLDRQAKEDMWNETLWFHGTTPKDDRLNMSWERKGRQTAAAAVFALRPRTSPQAIDLTWKATPARDFMPKGIDPAWEQATWDPAKLDRVQPGIYSIEGNRLRLCWGELGGDRPTSLETKRGDKRTIHLYERKAAQEQTKKMLVGKWEDPDRPGNGLEFKPDGRFTASVSGGVVRAHPMGTYRVLENGSLQMRVKVGDEAARPRTFEVRVTKDTLTLIDAEKQESKYRRTR